MNRRKLITGLVAFGVTLGILPKSRANSGYTPEILRHNQRLDAVLGKLSREDVEVIRETAARFIVPTPDGSTRYLRAGDVLLLQNNAGEGTIDRICESVFEVYGHGILPGEILRTEQRNGEKWAYVKYAAGEEWARPVTSPIQRFSAPYPKGECGYVLRLLPPGDHERRGVDLALDGNRILRYGYLETRIVPGVAVEDGNGNCQMLR